MLSVVLATHNEEKNVSRCLDAVSSIADEIIVVDGESTDRTVEIVTAMGAQVISTTNKSNFHINKQLAIDAAQGELILQLDADEVVDKELFSFIEKLKLAVASDTQKILPVAWSLRRRNFFLGRFLSKGGQYPDPVIRLFKTGKARLPQKNVHEQMVVDGETAVAEGHLLHYAFPDFATYVRKFNTYTSFEAERLFLNKTIPTNQLAYQYWLLKPLKMFFSLYLRHRGYVDGFSGFSFALLSALHHPFTYLKLQELQEKEARYD